MTTDEETRTDRERARRAAVDLIGETRSRAVRVALFGTLLHRPDPDCADPEAERAHNFEVLAETVRWIERVRDLLGTGRDPWERIPDPVCDWLRPFSKAEPGVVALVAGLAETSRGVVRAAEDGGPALGTALDAHYEARRGPFMGEVTRFCDIIWSSIDDDYARRMAAATQAVQTTLEALERMEHISKHVRLVAINAKIEASRLGDNGLGIGLIAGEFKSLAEELQALSSHAHSDISVIVRA